MKWRCCSDRVKKSFSEADSAECTPIRRLPKLVQVSNATLYTLTNFRAVPTKARRSKKMPKVDSLIEIEPPSRAGGQPPVKRLSARSRSRFVANETLYQTRPSARVYLAPSVVGEFFRRSSRAPSVQRVNGRKQSQNNRHCTLIR